MSTRRDFLKQAAVGVTSAAAGLQLAQARTKDQHRSKSSMGSYKIAHTDLVVSRIAYGGGPLGGSWDKQPVDAETAAKTARLVHTAYDNGITLFDNADVYAFGKSEEAFGQVLKQSPGLRNHITLQSKCGIRIPFPMSQASAQDPPYFDFSREHIIRAVEGSLKRLDTDRMDILLLHRPDALVEPEEVAEAFEELHRSGKVRYFGVSNHTAAQIELLKKYVRQPLVVNQVQVGLTHLELITEGLDFNREGERRLTQGYTGAAGTLDYCRLHDIQVQAYSPVRGLSSPDDASPAVKKTMELLKQLAQKKNTTPFALALAWLMRHPARIVPISGADKPEYIVENCTADRIEISRPEWYGLLLTAAGMSPMTKIL